MQHNKINQLRWAMHVLVSDDDSASGAVNQDGVVGFKQDVSPHALSLVSCTCFVLALRFCSSFLSISQVSSGAGLSRENRRASDGSGGVGLLSNSSVAARSLLGQGSDGGTPSDGFPSASDDALRQCSFPSLASCAACPADAAVVERKEKRGTAVTIVAFGNLSFSETRTHQKESRQRLFSAHIETMSEPRAGSTSTAALG